MFCKWCGMESATTDKCSWCHKDFSSATTQQGSETASPPEPHPEPAVAQVTLAPAPAARPAAEPSLTAEAVPTSTPDHPEPVSEKAPWTLAPPPVTPAPPTAQATGGTSAGDPAASRPIIGVKRAPGAAGGHIPAPSMPPPSMASRPPAPGTPLQPKSGNPNSIGVKPHIPASSAPPSSSPALGVNRDEGNASAPSSTPPASAPPPTVTPRPAAPTNRPAVPVASGTPTATSSRPVLPQTMMGGVSSPSATSSAPPQAAPRPHIPQTVNAPQAAASGGLASYNAAPPAAAPEPFVPQIGTFQAVKSKYYADQVIDPISGTHYDAESGRATATATLARPASQVKESDIVLRWDDEKPSGQMQLGRYLGFFAAILVFAGAISYALPQFYVIPLLLSQFFGALLLPIFKVVPWQDEDSDHVFGFVLLTALFGPLVGLIIYSVIGALRQDANPAIVGVFGVAALSQLVCGAAAGGFGFAALMPFSPSSGFNIQLIAANYSAFVALAGWIAANSFHKFDE